MCNQACAIGKNHLEAVEASFQSAASPAAREDRLTALMRAALIGHTGAITALLACGLDVNARDQYGRTALMEAASKSRCCAVRTLLAYGADVNAACKNGWTALKVTPRADTEIITMLKRAGAKNTLNL